MRIAITGAGGFLGGAVAERLIQEGHEVLALDTTVSDLTEGAEMRLCDVSDGASTGAVLDAFKPEIVLHLAAVLTTEAQADIIAATRINALGTANVFAGAMAAGAHRIVYASSIAALGLAITDRGDLTVPQPGSVYGATKAFGEHLATAL